MLNNKEYNNEYKSDELKFLKLKIELVNSKEDRSPLIPKLKK
jgi:hypothetical protein